MGAGGASNFTSGTPSVAGIQQKSLNIVIPLQEWASGWRYRFVRRDGCDEACASIADGVSGHGEHGISHIGTGDGRGLGLVGSTRSVVGRNLPVPWQGYFAPLVRLDWQSPKTDTGLPRDRENGDARCRGNIRAHPAPRSNYRPRYMMDTHLPPMLAGRDAPRGPVVRGGSGCLSLCSRASVAPWAPEAAFSGARY